MAIYFLNIKTFGRSTGSSAPGAAAYRAGERIRDERTGKIYDHSERSDVLHREILLPSRLAADDIGWAKDRSVLWNAAESAETRNNARVAREFLVALPIELSPVQRLGLAQGFSRDLTERYGFALDLTVHAPRDFPGSDARNFHAHLLATTRQAGIEGLGAKTILEMNDAARRSMGLGPLIQELVFARERWATMSNEALREAGVSARIDHRSLTSQGIDREPRPRIPRAAFEMERHGYRSVVAERMRDEFEERSRAREQRAAEAGANRQPLSLEDTRMASVEKWLRMRRGQEPEPEQARKANRDKADDLSL